MHHEAAAVLAGRYELVSALGEGGLSQVWFSWDKRTARACVVKVARDDLGDGCAAARESLLNEARIMRGLAHPLLPRLLDAGEDAARGGECGSDAGRGCGSDAGRGCGSDAGRGCEGAAGRGFIVMERMEGEPLSRVLERRGGRLPAAEVLAVGLRLCDVLEYLHAQEPAIIHGDLKPGNVLLASDGRVRLVDFGAAMRVGEQERLSPARRLGTKGYAAPEQHRAGASIDARADIYGLGATLYRLARGERFDGSAAAFEKLRSLRPRCLRRILRRCLQADPAARFRDCRSLRRALARCRYS